MGMDLCHDVVALGKPLLPHERFHSQAALMANEAVSAQRSSFVLDLWLLQKSDFVSLRK